MRYLLFAFAFLIGHSTSAQLNPRLEGLWTGTITDSTGVEHKFELVLKLERKGKLTGTAFYHEFNGEVVEWEFTGKIHLDKSMNLYDNSFLNPDEIDFADTRPRVYQLLFRRSAFGDTLNGFWQAHDGTVGTRLRNRFGKIRLEKKPGGV